MDVPRPSDPLHEPPQAFRRLGPALANELEGRGLATARDLLLHRPSRYEDRRRLASLADVRPGERATVLAELRHPRPGRMRRGGMTLTCQLADPTDRIAAVWFNVRPWQLRELTAGRRFFLTGAVRAGKAGGRILSNPEYEPADGEGDEPGGARLHTGRVVPLYPGTSHQRAWRSLVGAVLARVLPALEDPFPAELLAELELWPLGRALRELHFPGPEARLEELALGDSEAHRRLAFDELYFLSLALAERRRGQRRVAGPKVLAERDRIERAVAALPFPPTGAQRRAIEEIGRDLGAPHPMQRLLEGDVGSGKTAVAAVALRLVVESGLQAALMAPTELLAEQHARTLGRLLAPAGIAIELVTSASGGAQRATGLAAGRPGVVVGTQALVQPLLSFGALGLAVIDEQHRFGVSDRLRISEKGKNPHVLLLSATPIPRTLALAIHGDLDVSVLDELPPGRTPIETALLVGKSRARAFEALRAELALGRRAYVVYPLVEESEKLDLADATRGAERLRKALPSARIGLVHGRLPSAERERVMAAFRDGALDLLVATTVVEVGVDVPEATLMIISGADRFGLSQLHQLRGRVGRGEHASRCFLLVEKRPSQAARERLRALCELCDGFRLAEIDLRLRGPGELIGTRQSGLPELRFADPVRQPELLARARELAFERVERDPALLEPQSRRTVEALERMFGGRRSLGSVA